MTDNFDDSNDDSNIEELLTGILWRLRAMHLAILDPAEGRRQMDQELQAAEKRRLEATGIGDLDGADLH